MENKKMSKEELKWQADEDARTLERYQEIMNDKGRLSRATKRAQEQVNNLQERANALSKSITGIKKRK